MRIALPYLKEFAMIAPRLAFSFVAIGSVLVGCGHPTSLEIAGDASAAAPVDQREEYWQRQANDTRKQIETLNQKHGIDFPFGDWSKLRQSNPEAFGEFMALKRREVEQLRRAFPYRPVTARLEYESRTGERAEVRLSPAARDHLAAMEKRFGQGLGYTSSNLRSESLRLLHAEETEKFIAREGFGVSRVIPPSPRWIPLWPAEPIPFAEAPVYVSKHLPQMNELRDAPTRPLVEFEATALTQLQAGEDLVTRATPNRIEMLGSLRAMQQCLDCHQVQRGELLGAFSYELIRNPRLQTIPDVTSPIN
jgi:hypothetical protein